jgi:hypothetical protein
MRSLPCWLKSDKVLMRLAALWLICALLFTVAWTTSYYLLPEGILRGKLLGQYIPIETSHVITTLVRIFGVNLLAGCGLVALANLFQVGDTSLGYQIVMFHAGLYGVLLGTNSFGIPAPARFAPSLSTVLSRMVLSRSPPISPSPPPRGGWRSCGGVRGWIGTASRWDPGGSGG